MFFPHDRRLILSCVLSFWVFSVFFSKNVSVADELEPRVILNDAYFFTDLEGDDDRLMPADGVELGVELGASEYSESKLRGGDGRVALIRRGGWIAVSETVNRKLCELTGREITLGVRMKPTSNIWESAPVFSKNGGHDQLAFNLFFFSDSLGAEVGTTGNRSLLQTLAPRSETRNPDERDAWRDVFCRINGAKMELFLDGRCCDEDFMLGDLKTNEIPFVIGAQYDSSDPESLRPGFEGEIDYVAIWDRSLSDEEITALSGGVDRIDPRERTERVGSESMQYWTPPNHYGVGDCMPFYAEGVFHFMYLLDKNRHGAKNGFGAHQWIQATSTDLVHWRHQPFVLAIEDQNEGSICTGAVMFHNGRYYAFYANRAVEFTLPDGTKKNVFGLLGVATSEDGLHFEKQEPNPLFLLPEGYASSTRDPFVFQSPEDGRFYMMITTSYLGKGCWARAVSDDLKEWQVLEPFYAHMSGEPECPDLFHWGNDYYLIANHLNGYYLMSKSPQGPWEAPNKPNVLMNGMVNVPKTAPFGEDRRIICGWTRERGFGGSAVFHELIRFEDGTLGEKFVSEMIPRTGAEIRYEDKIVDGKINVPTPQRFRLQLSASFDPSAVDRMRNLRIAYAPERSIIVSFSERAVYLNDVKIDRVDFSTGCLTLDCVAPNHVVDLCVNESRTATYASRDDLDENDPSKQRSIQLINESNGKLTIERLSVAPIE